MRVIFTSRITTCHSSTTMARNEGIEVGGAAGAPNLLRVRSIGHDRFRKDSVVSDSLGGRRVTEAR